MKADASLSTVEDLMNQFADSTGLYPADNFPRRYLWTDAFAVCNFLGLYRQTGDDTYRKRAVDLVDQVHHVLGRHRQDDPRAGWISGLDEQEGRAHPTGGGLRIGKKMNERRSLESYTERLEWDRDGQYYHYLTKWMHALNQMFLVTQDTAHCRWAMELAKTAHAAFTYRSSGGEKRMYWKMSIDLSTPLVHAMGHHDPLDGFITYMALQTTAREQGVAASVPDLESEIADMAAMCKEKDWTSTDPLGIGGLLTHAYTLARLVIHSNYEHIGVVEDLLYCALAGLNPLKADSVFTVSAEHRLAFRELGLAIGLRAADNLGNLVHEHASLRKRPLLKKHIDALMAYMPLGERIADFWLQKENRETQLWKKHRDINMVMLATGLCPDGYFNAES
jgi:hypothetical protein